MASITLDESVKAEHEALKPESMTWSDHMHIVAQSIDADRFEQLVEAFDQREHEASVGRARERSEKARADPDRMLSAEEARDEAVDLSELPTFAGGRPGVSERHDELLARRASEEIGQHEGEETPAGEDP